MARDKILAGKCYIYVGDRGTVKPAPVPDDRASLPTDWILIAQGDYDSAIEMNFGEEKNDVRTMNETFKVKKFRSGESITYTTSLIDMLPDTLVHLFHNQTVVKTPAVSGVAGYQELDFERGFSVVEKAILLIGQAPFADPNGGEDQMLFWHPAVDIEGPGTFSRSLADPSMPTMMIDVIKHETLGVGGLVANDEAP